VDPVTHTLAGFCIAASLPRTIRGRDVTVLAVAASLAPDADVLWAVAQPATAALTRHTFTHSLLGVGLIAVGLGACAWLLFRRLPLLAYFGVAALGLLGHLGLDLINDYGVELLYPWSERRFELPLAFILDPTLTAILLGGTLAFLLMRDANKAAFAGRAALLLAACYLLAAFVLRTSALHIVEARARAAGTSSWTYLVPEPGGPLRWKGIYRSGDSYAQLLVLPLTGRVEELPAVHSTPDDPLVVAARATQTGQEIEDFFAVPVWRTDGETVVGYDLRFRFAVLGNDWDPFQFCFRPGSEGLDLVRQGLGIYVLNWWRALLKFGVSPSMRFALSDCSVEGIAPRAQQNDARTGGWLDRHSAGTAIDGPRL
jgi:inner membrane protein